MTNLSSPIYKTVYLLLPTDAVAFSGAHFGAGTGTIHLDNVGCTGSENNLIDCSRSSIVSCYRGHLEDAGVRCQGIRLQLSNFCNITIMAKNNSVLKYLVQYTNN